MTFKEIELQIERSFQSQLTLLAEILTEKTTSDITSGI